MENSSKALLIAAAVLIVILLIAVGIKIFNSPQDVQQQATDVGMSISREVEDATEDLSSSFEINREFISGEVSGNPSDETQGSDSTTNWHIKNVDELKQFADLVNSGNNFEGITVYLDANLDLNNENWTPIGKDADNKFKGVFDGKGHSIKRIKVEVDYYAGLFGIATNTIKNLTVEDSYIAANNTYAGGVVGYSKGTLQDIIVRNSNIKSLQEKNNNDRTEEDWEKTSYVGGIVGNGSGEIINCNSENNNIDGIMLVGGIVGGSRANITNCINSSTVNGIHRVGGIAGQVSRNTNTDKCVNYGNITGTQNVGGILGILFGNKLSNSYNSGTITADKHNLGGVCGSIGICGTEGNVAEAHIESCYNIGKIIVGKDFATAAGGVVGWLSQTNTYSYVNNNYNIGTIELREENATLIGGVIGRAATIASEEKNNYYLETFLENRTTNSNIAISALGISKSKSDMKTQDFVNLLNTGLENNAWEIKSGVNNGYPVIVGMN